MKRWFVIGSTLIIGITSGFLLAANTYYSAGLTVSDDLTDRLKRYWSTSGKAWNEVEGMLRHGSRKLLLDVASHIRVLGATGDDIRNIFGPPDAVFTVSEPDSTNFLATVRRSNIPGKNAKGIYVYKIGRFGHNKVNLKDEVLIIIFSSTGVVHHKVVGTVPAGSALADLSRDTRTEKRIATTR